MATLRLDDVLIFLTGADRVPPMGFGKSPQIPYSKFNTCAPSLTLMIIHDTPEIYINFVEHMAERINQQQEFGVHFEYKSYHLLLMSI